MSLFKAVFLDDEIPKTVHVLLADISPDQVKAQPKNVRQHLVFWETHNQGSEHVRKRVGNQLALHGE